MKKWLTIVFLLWLMAGTGVAERIWICTDLHISREENIQREAMEALIQ